VKQGRYFRIPESPTDLEQLWAEANPLTVADSPDWLTPEDVMSYRCLNPASITSSPEDQNPWVSEVHALESAGLVVHQDSREPSIHHLYVPEPNEDVWSIGIYQGQTPFDLRASAVVRNPVLTREHITDVPATFVADPFMIRVDGIWRMFFEVMNWKTGKGEIGLAESPDGYSWKYRQIVLAEPFHLSYPYVFEWQGGYYMVPESYQAKSIRLYRAEAFPTRWSFIATLMYGPYLVDPSIFRHSDKWWLFAETNPDVKHDCLRLYYSDELAGPWIEHPKSPIIQNNPKIARPAGRVLGHRNRMIRFAQDCSISYGSEVRAFAVSELTTENYAEQLVGSGPILAGSGSGWNAEGMHHVDAHAIGEDQWIACVDGRRKPRFEAGKNCQ
jgi:hypothetical protein